MGLFKKMKANVNSWVKDEKNKDIKSGSAISEYLKISDQIEVLWLEDDSYKKTQSDITTLKVMLELSDNKDEQSLKDLQRLLLMLSGIKRLSISNNASYIYGLVRVINSIQRKYIELYPLIGKPINIDEVLGLDGSKLKSGDPDALSYIDGLIIVADNLKVEKNNINAREIERSNNKLF